MALCPPARKLFPYFLYLACSIPFLSCLGFILVQSVAIDAFYVFPSSIVPTLVNCQALAPTGLDWDQLDSIDTVG